MAMSLLVKLALPSQLLASFCCLCICCQWEILVIRKKSRQKIFFLTNLEDCYLLELYSSVNIHWPGYFINKSGENFMLAFIKILVQGLTDTKLKEFPTV